ncbi:MAG: Hpt domain-containing protein [Myxococcota bacterium]
MDSIHSEYESDPDMMDLVQEFAAELPERIRMMEELLSRGDWEELQRLAHQLKGAGGGYGFPQITEVSARLEQALKESAGEGRVKELCGELGDTLRAVEVSRGS